MKNVLFVLAVAAVAALAAPVAGAGGWATVGLSSLPADTPAGGTWTVDMTVLQHGRTPLEGVAPVITITGGNGATRQFTGTPTGKAGVYRAEVVFPRSGTWSYEVWDGFTRSHTFKPVEIGAPPGGSFPFLPLAAALALALALAAGTALVVRNRRAAARPASVTNLEGAA